VYGSGYVCVCVRALAHVRVYMCEFLFVCVVCELCSIARWQKQMHPAGEKCVCKCMYTNAHLCVCACECG